MIRKIIPTVFSKNKEEFEARFKIIQTTSKEMQIDFMDGKFVKSKSVSLKEIKLDKGNKYEAHLMTFKPYFYLQLLKNKGFSKVIFHYESCDAEEIEKTISLGHKLRLKVFIALNPETPITLIIPFLNEVDGVLLMGVNPGKENQRSIPEVYDKIKELRKVDKKIIIQIDGGVDIEIAKTLRKLGANILNTGSFVAEAEEPKKALNSLKKAFL